jgi:hypothetical protein
MIDVFVSRPNWTPPGITPHLSEFYDLLEQVGFQPKTIGENVVPMSSPFEEVRILMKQCKCTIVLGLHQIVAPTAKVKGNSNGRLILPTEWNQIEATMSLMLNLPTLVLLHENVTPRGIFERGAANVFVHSFQAQHHGWSKKIKDALLQLKSRVSP